jgi:hypothetical protein
MIGSWLVVDNPFNRHWHNDIVGHVLEPGKVRPYCLVRPILNEDECRRLLAGEYVYGTKLAMEVIR